MIFERIKAEGLAQNSYFVGSQSAAAVIDPIRDIDWYLNLAIKYGTKIKYVFETHRNEDFVIGSVELAAATGAEIYHGSWMDFKYGNPLQDGQEFNIGKLNVTAIHTPGHTDESMSFVLKEKSAGQMPVMVFTGDALFVNDTGRVDFGGIGDIPRMASNLFDSLFNRLLTLGDGTIICPAHGAGSVCGSNIAERDESTIGIEKQNNPALKLTLKDNFIRYKAAEKHEKPTYFSMMEKYNLEGPPLLNKLPLVSPLGHTAFKKALEEGYQVIDTRSPAAFGAHIKGTYHIWLAGVPSYAGWYLDYRKPILLILEDDNQLDKAVRYLIRLGYDNIAGYLKGGFDEWYNAGLPVEKLGLLSIQDLNSKLEKSEPLRVLDVRAAPEWEAGHIRNAQNIYVGHIEEKATEFLPDQPVALICSVGHRAGIAASILQKAGVKEVYNVLGGMTAWQKAGYPVVVESPL